ncbi:MAG: keratin associated protein [Labilithrix sp.]|nr:keratin associated protein [Labilithrix sp.]
MVVAACGSSKPPPPAPVPTVSSRCPDLAKADEVAAFDFAKDYQLSRDAADKLKAAALAAMEIGLLADKLDAELGIACAQIAHDLGNKGDWRSGNEACGAAIKAVHDARAKLAKASATLVVRVPVCSVDATLMTKCASICDSSVPAGRVKADCEQKAGRCDGNCDGICEAKTSTKCDGTCSGACDGAIKGTCGGRCKGTCDGKPANGPCPGACVGTCEKGAINGECKGACSGSCKLKAPGICDGLCAGKCTVELADAKCAGEFKTPDVSTDCRARCELAAINQTECSTPQVGIVVTGAAPRDRDTAEAMKTAVDKSFPALLKILFEVGDKGGKRVLNAQAVIEGARKGFPDMAMSGGKATAAKSEAQLATCFDDAFKKAEAYAATVKTGLDQAQAVKEEATK